MKKIITIVKPFDKMQYIHVYEDGECLFNQGIPMESIEERIPEIATQYGISEIDIAGPKAFTQKLKEEIEKYNLTQYKDNRLTINLI